MVVMSAGQKADDHEQGYCQAPHRATAKMAARTTARMAGAWSQMARVVVVLATGLGAGALRMARPKASPITLPMISPI